MESESQAPVTKRFADERRSEGRVDVRLVARLAHPTGIIYGNLENVSAGGASFVTTSLDPELESGTEVVLILTSPPYAISEEVHCTAHIVRAEDFITDSSATITYAVQFDEPLILDVLLRSN